MSTKKVAIPPPGYRKEGETMIALRDLVADGEPQTIPATKRSWYLHQAKKLRIKIATRKVGKVVRVYLVK